MRLAGIEPTTPWFVAIISVSDKKSVITSITEIFNEFNMLPITYRPQASVFVFLAMVFKTGEAKPAEAINLVTWKLPLLS